MLGEWGEKVALLLALFGLFFGLPLYRALKRRFGGPRWIDYDAFRMSNAFSESLIRSACRADRFKLKLRTVDDRVCIRRDSANRLTSSVRKLSLAALRSEDSDFLRTMLATAAGVFGSSILEKEKNAVPIKINSALLPDVNLSDHLGLLYSRRMKDKWVRYTDFGDLIIKSPMNLDQIRQTIRNPEYSIEWDFMGFGYEVDESTREQAIEAIDQIADGKAVSWHTATLGLGILEVVLGDAPVAAPKEPAPPQVDSAIKPSVEAAPST